MGKCSRVRCHETLPSVRGAAGASAADSHYYPIKAAGAELGGTCHLPTARLAAGRALRFCAEESEVGLGCAAASA